MEGAAGLLERDFHALDDDDRAALGRVLGSGTRRLWNLLGQESSGGRQLSLAEAAAMAVKEIDWHDALDLDVGPELKGTGSPTETAEALRQLLRYAHRRSPDDVRVHGERDGSWVVLRVDDRGPTLSRQQRRTILDPDKRRGPEREDAMELHLAARLMRGQGGDLWVEARPGGGSSFGICLPALDSVGDVAGA
jgi:signal transduction histidine kinase